MLRLCGMAMVQSSHAARDRAAVVGVQALSDAELVALLLGTGRGREPVDVLAAALLEEHGGVRGLARAGLGELVARAGVGRAKGARVAAALELGRRSVSAPRSAWRFAEIRTVDAWARPRFADLEHEELWVLALDGANALRAARRVAMGGLHGVHVCTRDPLRAALREGASAFILVHNHPSGDPTPSAQDVEFTERIEAASLLVGTPLLDHVIVAREGFRSVVDRHILPPSPRLLAARREAGRGADTMPELPP